MILSGTINVEKIDKKRLFKGEKGTYLDIKIIMSDEEDQYGNIGFICENTTKEEYTKGVKGTILGNVKKLGQATSKVIDDDELPF